MIRPSDAASSDDSDEPSPVAALAGVVAHELGEVVALLDGYTELLGPAAPDDATSGLRRTTERLREDYEDLLELWHAASAPPARSAVDPAAALATALQRLRDAAAGPGAGVQVEVPPLPAVVADRGELEQLFVHVLRTVVTRAGSRGKDIVVRGSCEGAEVTLDIAAGRAPPSVATRRPGGSAVGHGIGLAVSNHIATRNGGRLWVEMNRRSGPTISVTLPAAQQ